MLKLKELLMKIPVVVLKILLVLSILGFLASGDVMKKSVNELEAEVNGVAPPSYFCFEFVWNAQRADVLLKNWGESKVKAAVTATRWDNLFLIAYGLMGFSLVLLVTRLLSSPGWVKGAGLVFCLFPLIAAVCDAVENMNLLAMLHRFPEGVSSLNAFSASLFASIKFGLLGLTLLFFLVQVVTLVVEKIKG